MKKVNIAFIGAGNMGMSLVGGLLKDGYPSNHIWLSDPSEEKCRAAVNTLKVHAHQENSAVVEQAEVVVFCVKPQVLKTVVTELAEVILSRSPLLISIAAGVRSAVITQWLGGDNPLVRCMPNTPALLGSGATALFANALVSERQQAQAESILRAVGVTVWLKDEAAMDIVTALSGSGPAYYFYLMEALEEAAIKAGLDENTAHLLTLQTALGAARMALEIKKDIPSLRQQVTSKGGTTEAAVKVLDAGQTKKIFSDALNAARARSIELADLFAK